MTTDEWIGWDSLCSQHPQTVYDKYVKKFACVSACSSYMVCSFLCLCVWFYLKMVKRKLNGIVNVFQSIQVQTSIKHQLLLQHAKQKQNFMKGVACSLSHPIIGKATNQETDCQTNEFNGLFMIKYSMKKWKEKMFVRNENREYAATNSYNF